MKTALVYINETIPKLKEKYVKLMETLDYKLFEELMEEIIKEKAKTPQYIGKFRSTMMEEYVAETLRRKLNNPNIKVVRQYEMTIGEYKFKVDIAVLEEGKIKHIIECKVELDSSRLKTAIGELILAKLHNPNIKVHIVYYKPEISIKLLKLASKIVNIIKLEDLARNPSIIEKRQSSSP